jgi:hypothetical protein
MVSKLSILRGEFFQHLGLLERFTTCQGFEDGNWKYWFNPGNVVSDSAEIFEACMNGDLDRVISLVAANRASVHDTTETGITALHVSYCNRSRLLELLCEYITDVS